MENRFAHASPSAIRSASTMARRLIRNCIIFWRYLYPARQVEEARNSKMRNRVIGATCRETARIGASISRAAASHCCAGPDQIDQPRRIRRSGEAEAAGEIAPEPDAELGAGLHSAEMRGPGGPPQFAPGAEGDLSLCRMSPNVAFDAVREERRFRMI